MENSKLNVIKDYDKLDDETKEQIKLVYPKGFNHAIVEFTKQLYHDSRFFTTIMPVRDGIAAVTGRIADPALAIISLTITEKGYALKGDGLDADHRRAWLYLGVFPNFVFGIYPDSVIFYQEFPVEVGDDGLLSRLEQGGWEVLISRYREGGGQPMPRILTATNPDTRVRMVVDRWLFFEN